MSVPASDCPSLVLFFFFFRQETAYEMRISDWSSDVCSSDLVVERGVVRSAFPDNRRTWLHFREGSWTGANLFALNTPAALKVLSVWAEIEQHRKKGWRLIGRFGPLLLLRALTRTITLEQALERAGRKIGADVRAVAIADPLAAVAVDKLSDHAQIGSENV